MFNTQDKNFYIAGVLYSLIVHIAIFALMLRADSSAIMHDESGTDATLGDKNTSIMILSTLPIGQLKEVALNAKKSIKSTKDSAKKSSISDIAPNDTQKAITHAQALDKATKNNNDMRESSEDFSDVSSPSQSADFTNSTQKQQYASTPKEAKDNTLSTTALGASSSDKLSYQGLLGAHLSRFKQYPSSALARQEEGIIIIKLQVDENGFILQKEIKKKCAYNTLNTEVIALIDRANPLPPPPKEMLQGGKLTFSMPISYSIKDYYKK